MSEAQFAEVVQRLDALETPLPGLARQLAVLKQRAHGGDLSALIGGGRTMIEAVLRHVLAVEFGEDPGKRMLDDLAKRIMRLQKDQPVLPRMIQLSIGTVQIYGNAVMHPDSADLSEVPDHLENEALAAISLTALLEVLDWFHGRYGESASGGGEADPTADARPTSGPSARRDDPIATPGSAAEGAAARTRLLVVSAVVALVGLGVGLFLWRESGDGAKDAKEPTAKSPTGAMTPAIGEAARQPMGALKNGADPARRPAEAKPARGGLRGVGDARGGGSPRRGPAAAGGSLHAQLTRLAQALAPLVGSGPGRRLQAERISYRDTPLFGPVAGPIRHQLREALTLARVPLAPLADLGQAVSHRLEGRYESQGTGLVIRFTLQDRAGQILHRQAVTLSGGDAATLPRLLPANHEQILPALQAFSAQRSGDLHLELRTARGQTGAIFRHAEKLSIKVRASKDCYLQVFYLQPDGKVIRVFPNEHHKSHRIKGGKTYTLPSKQFNLEVDCSGGCGQEAIKAVASAKPLPSFPGTSIVQGFRAIKVTPARFSRSLKVRKKLAEVACTLLTVRP